MPRLFHPRAGAKRTDLSTGGFVKVKAVKAVLNFIQNLPWDVANNVVNFVRVRCIHPVDDRSTATSQACAHATSICIPAALRSSPVLDSETL
jgi:hypothetical protein